MREGFHVRGFDRGLPWGILFGMVRAYNEREAWAQERAELDLRLGIIAKLEKGDTKIN